MFVKTGYTSYDRKEGLNVIFKFGFWLPQRNYTSFATPGQDAS